MKRRIEPSPAPHPSVLEPGPAQDGYHRCSFCDTDIPYNQWVSHRCGFGPKKHVTRPAVRATVVAGDIESTVDGADEEDGDSSVGTSQQNPSSSHKQPSSSQQQPSSSQRQPSSSQRQPSSSQRQPSSSQLQPSSSQLQPSSSQLQPSSSQQQQKQQRRLEAALCSCLNREQMARHDLAFLETIVKRGLSAHAVVDLMRTVQQVRAVALRALPTCTSRARHPYC